MINWFGHCDQYINVMHMTIDIEAEGSIKPSLCNWVWDFLTNRPPSVKIHGVSSSTITLTTGSPQGCVLRPLLYTLLTSHCPAWYPSNWLDGQEVEGLVDCLPWRTYMSAGAEAEHRVSWRIPPTQAHKLFTSQYSSFNWSCQAQDAQHRQVEGLLYEGVSYLSAVCCREGPVSLTSCQRQIEQMQTRDQKMVL